MKAELPEQKYNRLSAEIRNAMLTDYPNPGRVGCPGPRAVENVAKGAAQFREQLEEEHGYEHIMHCSPCYREFLDAREALRAMSPEKPSPMPRRVEKRLGRTLERFEKIMKSAREELARNAARR